MADSNLKFIEIDQTASTSEACKLCSYYDEKRRLCLDERHLYLYNEYKKLEKACIKADNEYSKLHGIEVAHYYPRLTDILAEL